MMEKMLDKKGQKEWHVLLPVDGEQY